MEHVRLEIEHRQPDPHRREDLHEREPPIGHEQLESVEQHGEGADGEGERGKYAPRLAEAEDRLLNPGLVVVLDGPHQRPDPRRKRSEPPPAFPGSGVQHRMLGNRGRSLGCGWATVAPWGAPIPPRPGHPEVGRPHRSRVVRVSSARQPSRPDAIRRLPRRQRSSRLLPTTLLAPGGQKMSTAPAAISNSIHVVRGFRSGRESTSSEQGEAGRARRTRGP